MADAHVVAGAGAVAVAGVGTLGAEPAEERQEQGDPEEAGHAGRVEAAAGGLVSVGPALPRLSAVVAQ